MSGFPWSTASVLTVETSAEALFEYLDDHRNLSSHMARPSRMMMGSKIDVRLPAGGTGSVGAKFGFTGNVLGVPLAVEEVVTERDPPRLKAWTTVGAPRLWVIGRYRMGFRIEARQPRASLLTVFIDYDLPEPPGLRWLGFVLGGVYARWCTRRMAGDAARHFRQA